MIESKEKIKAGIAVGFIVICIFIVFIIMIMYAVEGEKNMSFNLKNILIISTAEGVEKKDADEKWNFNVVQNNDIYINIEKNEKINKETVLENLYIENIKIEEEPINGEIKVYMPNSSDGRTFIISEEYEIEDNKLTYKGGKKSNAKTLEIGNQGGNAVIRFSNVGLGKYISNEDEEIVHDATLLNKIGVEEQNIKFKVSFDLILKIDGNKYKTNIEIDLPCESMIENGSSNVELNGKEYIFKRM